MRERFNVVDYDKRYESLFNLNIKKIYTTNIDNLIKTVYHNTSNYYINDVIKQGLASPGSTAIDYIALHGSISDEQFDFTNLQLASSSRIRENAFNDFQISSENTPIIFWGYSLSNYGVLSKLSVNSLQINSKNSWIIVQEKDSDAESYFKTLGFNIIKSDTHEMLDYLSKLEPNTNHTNSNTQSFDNLVTKFQEYYIPKNAYNTPIRSIDDFFSGSEPIWYDIQGDQIPKTQYFSILREKIISNQNIIITGTALTGKTTLLQQLAFDFSNNNNCIYIKDITEEKAITLNNSIKQLKQKTIIFIDNITNSSRAIKTLIDNDFVQIVGTERDFLLDNFSDFFPKHIYEYIDVSLISKQDQTVIENTLKEFNYAIAKDIQNDDQNYLIDRQEKVTIYDIIRKQDHYQVISERFSEALDNLSTNSKWLYDTFLIICYCYNCRVPTSFETILSFLSAKYKEIDPNQYKNLYKEINSYENLIIDYDYTKNNDCYVPRSRIKAYEIFNHFFRKNEAHNSALSRDSLKNFLIEFHEQVHTSKIVNYHIFKSFAYDANFFNDAFASWEEGLKYYKEFQYRDQTHSYCQQVAIFLMKKKQFGLSFDWIQQAKKIAKGRSIHSVKNTHAIILFNANISVFSDYPTNASQQDKITAKIEIEKSMNMLIENYRINFLKNYHKKVFANQSMLYAKTFPNEEKGKYYLQTALQCIETCINEANEGISKEKNMIIKRKLSNLLNTD